LESQPEIPDQLVQKALKRIHALSKGNGVKKGALKIIEKNAKIITCEAITHIDLSHETTSKQQKGQHQVGEIIDDINALPKIIENLSKEAIKNTQMRNTISDMILNRGDKGFALHGQEFNIDALNREFSSFDPCQTCQGQGKGNCQTCQGRKVEQCHQCHGRRSINCSLCRGSGRINGSDGQQKQCTQCFGKSQINCPRCQSRGTVSCRPCNGSGQSQCNNCGGVGVFTTITQLLFKIKTLFEIDRTALPAPVVKTIENNGTQLVEKGHIHVKGEAVKREDGGLALTYNVNFPYAQVDFGVNGNPNKVHMFGYKGKMLKLSNFIDQLVEKNYALLQNASQNSGNVVGHIRKASKSRIIGEAILLCVTMRPKKAMMALKKKYPMGASNDLIKDLIIQSNAALINISRKSHYGGLAIGLAIAALINALYFIGPLRQIIAGIVGNNGTILMMADLAFIPLGGAIAMFVSKYMAARPLKKALGSLMPERQRARFKPRNNNASWPAFIGGAVVTFTVILITKFITIATTPSWFPF